MLILQVYNNKDLKKICVVIVSCKAAIRSGSGLCTCRCHVTWLEKTILPGYAGVRNETQIFYIENA